MKRPGRVDCADLMEPADNHVTTALTSSRNLPGHCAADGNRAKAIAVAKGGETGRHEARLHPAIEGNGMGE